jgi:hypothetical protein
MIWGSHSRSSEEYFLLGFIASVTSSLDLPHAFTLVSSSPNWPLKMEAICSSETSVNFQRTARRYNPEDNTLYFCFLLSEIPPEVIMKNMVVWGLMPRSSAWDRPFYETHRLNIHGRNVSLTMNQQRYWTLKIDALRASKTSGSAFSLFLWYWI